MHTHSHEHHEPHHHHHHHTELRGRKLLVVTLLNALITIAEVIGGLLSNSLSLLSDAIHNLGDTLSLVFAYIAQKIGSRKADTRFTFGYKRAEILAALLNATLLLVICVFLFKEAYHRYLHPEPIRGQLMLVVAVIGLLANLVSVLVLQKEKESNINTRAAYLHLLGDTLSSVAVIVGGIAIWRWNIVWIDPLITILVSLYIMWHTWGVLRQAVDILMQSAPGGVNVADIVREIELLDDVRDVHHLHLWQLNEEQIHFEAHINVYEHTPMTRVTEIRHAVQHILEHYHIHHSTLQIDVNCCGGNEKLIVEENASGISEDG